MWRTPPANYRECPIYKSFQQRKYYNLKLFIKPIHTQNQNVISKENYVQVSIGNASTSNNSNMPGHTKNYANTLKKLTQMTPQKTIMIPLTPTT